MGPLNDIAMEKLARELPDEYEVASECLLFDTFLRDVFVILLIRWFKMSAVFCFIADMVPRSGAGDSGSTVIKLDTVRRIAEKVSQSWIIIQSLSKQSNSNNLVSVNAESSLSCSPGTESISSLLFPPPYVFWARYSFHIFWVSETIQLPNHSARYRDGAFDSWYFCLFMIK